MLNETTVEIKLHLPNDVNDLEIRKKIMEVFDLLGWHVIKDEKDIKIINRQ